ncbi:AAA family ATPase [Candidatus Avelusimicrobium fimicolum]|jgi:putative ATP-dependent endonuclease of OLD family|uniref:AAA family ATPase n=1 Tax=Candidatus Avelusimicrobium fimicolum TaxID=3416216 RepID=UPI003D14CAE2
MNIRKIIINGYRTIKAIKIESLNDFNIFVGQNNHGKTNIFEAIEWFFNGPRKGEPLNILRHCLDSSYPVEVQIEFDGLQNAVRKMRNITNAAKFKAYEDNETILIRRTSANEGKKREIFDTVNNIWKDPGTGFDKALDDLLPRFEYIDTKKTFEDVSSYKKTTPRGIVLSLFLSEYYGN